MAGIRTGDVVLGVRVPTLASPAQGMRVVRDARQRADGAVAFRILRDGPPGHAAVGGAIG